MPFDRQPDGFPTHRHPSEFWEALGRAVATFGFLEETLGKAIFALKATTELKDREYERAYQEWVPKLERALTDALGKLISSYKDALSAHQNIHIDEHLEMQFAELEKANTIRNVLCHGSWRPPDENGFTVPLFVKNSKGKEPEVFETPIDKVWLIQVRHSVAELALSVANTVTQLGWQFPGSIGPGRPIVPTAS